MKPFRRGGKGSAPGIQIAPESIRPMARHLGLPLLLAIIGLTAVFKSVSDNERLALLEQNNPVRKAMLAGRDLLVRPQTDSLFESWSAEERLVRKEDGMYPSVLEYPVEAPLHNPTPADGNRTFSTCLLVMDDNHHLVEWLAYHYHVLPLRYMIVVVDPRSTTSPSYLFNRWRRKGMVIVEWEDKNFWKRRKTLKTTFDEFDLNPIPDDADLQVCLCVELIS